MRIDTCVAVAGEMFGGRDHTFALNALCERHAVFGDIGRIFAAVRRQYWPVIVMTLVGAAVGVAYVATAVPRFTAGSGLKKAVK